MYIDRSTVHRGDRSYTRYLLRESYREGKKVQHRTIANLSRCSPEEIEAIRLALRHKQNLKKVMEQGVPVGIKQGLSVGAVWLLYEMARRLGMVDALGETRQGKLALWQVMARVMDQGSRLSAVRLAGHHAACDVLDLGKFTEEDLYENLDWLGKEQARTEEALFRRLPRERSPGLFLYDVTSSYLEGTQNQLSAFGYNRDGKKGKRQIVIGLLCNGEGVPLSVEVFAGNVQDPQTLGPQIRKAAERFGAEGVTFVGDRGMIKGEQVKELGDRGFHYITAITKPQIERLLGQEVIQMGLFDQGLAEVRTAEGIRYVLRRNPARAEEIQKSREDKLASLRKECDRQNQYLLEHPRAFLEVAWQKLKGRAEQLKISPCVVCSAQNREITLHIDAEALAEESKLDGCYVLKTDLADVAITKELIHHRYKDLCLVESAFRSSKTVDLELRPIHVRLATRTRGHVFVVMMAYRIIQELARRWQQLDVTVQEGIDELCTLCGNEVTLNGAACNQIPQPRESIQRLLQAAQVQMPEVLPCKGVVVTTKKKLQSRRKMK